MRPASESIYSCIGHYILKDDNMKAIGEELLEKFIKRFWTWPKEKQDDYGAKLIPCFSSHSFMVKSLMVAMLEKDDEESKAS